MGPKVVEISRLGSLGTNYHLIASPIANHRVYYEREGDGFPQGRAEVSLVSPSLLVVRPSNKSVSTMP
jgi:hypothetical protein